MSRAGIVLRGDPASSARRIFVYPARSSSSLSAAAGAVGSSSCRKNAKTSTPSSRRGSRRAATAELLVVVRWLAEAQVAPRRRRGPVADADDTVSEPGLDSGSHDVVTEIEGEPYAGEGRDQPLEQRVVPCALDDDADAAETVAEREHTLCHDLRPAQHEPRRLDGEAKAVGNLLRPAAELLGGGRR